YAEVSPSGLGLKVIARGSLPAGAGRRASGLEVYTERRFFTVTGQRLPHIPSRVEDRQEVLSRLYDRLFPLEQGHVEGTPLVTSQTGLTDDQIIEAATRANGPKSARLWAGDISGYPSASEADLALLGILAYWTGGDAARMERLFSRSALGEREKWSRTD